MRKFRFVIIGFWAAFTLVSCSEDIRIPGFEAQKWKEDPNGCHGEREKLLAALLKGRTELIGKNEMAIKTLLGKPDSKDIRTRGQIFFEYGVVGGNLCDPSTIAQPEILRIRFDALDRVTEVAVY
jgi:hypothetical protein